MYLLIDILTKRRIKYEVVGRTVLFGDHRVDFLFYENKWLVDGVLVSTIDDVIRMVIP